MSLYFWLLYYWAWSHTLLFPDVMHTFLLWPSFLSTPAPKTVESSSVPSPSPVHSPAWHRLQLTAPPSPTAESGATPLPQFKNKVARFTSTYGLCPTFPSFTAAPQVVGECLHLPCKLWTTVATYLQPKQLKGVFSVALYISLGPILCKTLCNLQQPLANQ